MLCWLSAEKIINDVVVSREGTGYSIKEVFQPHLPVRLPCYDLAPVADLTLNSSLAGHCL